MVLLFGLTIAKNSLEALEKPLPGRQCWEIIAQVNICFYITYNIYVLCDSVYIYIYKFILQ